MWNYIIRIILRNRLANLIVIGILTAFMAYKGMNMQMSYKMNQMLPESDSTSIAYKQFKKTFGNDGDIIFLGIRTPQLFQKDFYEKWYDLTHDLLALEGVKEVLSSARLYQLKKNDSIRKFDFVPLIAKKPTTQGEVDAIQKSLYNLPIYDYLLYNRDNSSTIMTISLDKKWINDKKRIGLINQIIEIGEAFEKETGVDIHFSGLPYIRTVISERLKRELKLFIFLAMLIASLVLFIFFKSLKAVIFPMLIVIISVIWVMGTLVLLGYKITILTAILPPLLIIIGVENAIFLLNKYHHEYRLHENKIKALSRMVRRVGNATSLTNLTTAIGFAAFIFTGNKLLIELGILASVNILVVFLLSIILIPIFFSYLPAPNYKNTKHLESKFISIVIDRINWMVLRHRKVVYIITGSVLVIGFLGLSQLKTSGKLVDDISEKDKLYKDMVFLQNQVKGILPFEIVIDTKKPKGVLSLSTLRKIDRLQDTLMTYPEFSKPLSVVEVAKAAKQAFYNNKSKYYSLPNAQEKNFILSYLPSLSRDNSKKRTILQSFVDSTLQKTRISVQMANIGINRIKAIKQDLKPKINTIFNPKKYKVELTGATVVNLKGTDYMITNLLQSLLIALVSIVFIMILLFTSSKMVAMSMATNLLPQLLTAALMGFLDIPIKQSTLLIFSIALGISVDNTIHFLSRYRMELKENQWNIKVSVINALKETSYGMVYSFVVLFLGFGIFMLSGFGGTQALGYLVPFTLLIAVLANIFVLPSFILSLNNRITTKAFRKSMIDLEDEEL